MEGEVQMARSVFISHSSRDDATVAALHDALDALRVQVWHDARQLSPGDLLAPDVRAALEAADAVIVVLSPHTINSKWVSREIRAALEIQRARGRDAYPVIPIMLDGIEPDALHLWFDEEPLAVRLKVGPGGVQNVLPALLAGLGLALPTDAPAPAALPRAPLADLTLELRDPRLERGDGKQRAAATAELVYRLERDGVREVRSPRFQLVAPLGPIEADELRWYLERYVHWPSGPFRERARRVEALLPQWGRALHAAALEDPAAREVAAAWRLPGADVEQRFSVLVDRDLIAGVADDDAQRQRQAEADEGATALLGLPWELLRDDQGDLCQGGAAVRVRRRLPNRKPKAALVSDAPLRVLLVSPRPEDARAGYIDHRISARPVVEALAELGELAEVSLLTPPTFKALGQELARARARHAAYHVVHFDGHGVYAPETGLGALCFEAEDAVEQLDGRGSRLIDAAELAEVMRDQRVPLFFLEACQSARAERDPTSSVAGRLLQGGVASVVAMSHAVLVETARRFVTAFYRELLRGARVGAAMVAGQRDLRDDRLRLRGFDEDLRLDDWFVPVLYQEEDDPPLIHALPAEQVKDVLARSRALSLGRLPEAPPHGFVGRSRELLRAERLLALQPYAVLLGEGGEGKTTLAAELARWLALSGRCERVAFAALDRHGSAPALLMELGDQLVTGFVSLVARDVEDAWQALERALVERPTLVVLDNFESVLPPAPGAPSEGAFEPDVLDAILSLARRVNAAGATRLVITSREALPEPFASQALRIGRLERREAIDLVARALGQRHQAPLAHDPGESEDEIVRLVDAVGCHARSLSLLAREVAAAGVRVTTATLGELMARLHARHPDDRERSLFASVELSLRRLPAGLREVIRPLGVFQGGGHIAAMAIALGLDMEKPEELRALAAALVGVGLAEEHEYRYLRFDPGLAPLLLSEMSEAERAAATERWAGAMAQLAAFLYQQRSGDDPRMATALTVLDLANLLAALEHVGATASAEAVVAMAGRIESLLQPVGRPRALARASRVREAAMAGLGEWSHARFIAESEAVDRLIEAGRFAEAVAGAQSILERAQAAGEAAFAEAAYDMAVAYFRLGRALRMGGNAAAALEPLREARQRFQALADGGTVTAARMASASITEAGNCLQDLGRLDDAARAYEEAIRLGEQRGDVRDVATTRFQLGTVRLLQRRYDDALAAYHDARTTFGKLGEPQSVATAWHQIGMVHQDARHYPDAERAYQTALRLKVQADDHGAAASTLNQLGNLYAAMGRLEDAVRFYRQCAEAYRLLGDQANEGRACNNLADTLLKLERLDDARRAIERAIECKREFGHALEPWKTFEILARIERASGNAAAADAARQQAITAYLAYRRDGGESLSGGSRIFAAAAQALAAGQAAAKQAEFAQREQRPDLPAYMKPLLPKLRAILAGSRDPALAADPALDYDDAAELLLLLDHLTASEP